MNLLAKKGDYPYIEHENAGLGELLSTATKKADNFASQIRDCHENISLRMRHENANSTRISKSRKL